MIPEYHHNAPGRSYRILARCFGCYRLLPAQERAEEVFTTKSARTDANGFTNRFELASGFRISASITRAFVSVVEHLVGDIITDGLLQPPTIGQLLESVD